MKRKHTTHIQRSDTHAAALRAPESTSSTPANQLDSTTPLRIAGLAPRAVNALGRCQIHTVGELLALPQAQIRAIHAIGSKTANDTASWRDWQRRRAFSKPPSRHSRNADPANRPQAAT
jgi:DNA-directed RNA polymerase alpha subunit